MPYASVMVMIGLPVLSSYKSLMETIIFLIFSTVGCYYFSYFQYCWLLVYCLLCNTSYLFVSLFIPIMLCQRFWLKFLLIIISLQPLSRKQSYLNHEGSAFMP